MHIAALIRELGRGKHGARSLTRDVAAQLWAAILAEQVSALELGAVLIALRVKGESVEELHGFLDATHAALQPIAHAAGSVPVVIPSYNGARQLPNLVPLLAALSTRAGVPALVHGVEHDPMSDARRHGPRVTSADIFRALGWPCATRARGLDAAWREARAAGLPLFVPIDVLHPALARVLQLRAVLGVRNSAHTIAKLLQPFDAPALRVTSYTHPEYRVALDALFVALGADALLMRATEGEAAANARRAQRIDAYDAGHSRVVIEGDAVAIATESALPVDRSADHTAAWTRAVLEGSAAAPDAIRAQIDAIVDAAARIARRTATQQVSA